ncbi:hypothetical protein SAMN06265375_10483 [Muriicola jejuensis]|uniref:Uncharacterized protein n=1 Tax=Muriicola jejuensis TaxID=504488 RepID=A0A6P0UH16_9FLAO|nr:hypothetical protein [Muriicola jejuensis]NER11098.1 hypothetical protein [Muriicola jejuensis]SMP23723.1 hypothetical protein SAMN06265375_10483 [Muriicola jejuensis]
MRSLIITIGSLCCLLWFSSCRKDFEYLPSSGNLQFSKDTVYLDTVFTNIGSSTYSLKVYNRSRSDIEIPSIRLEEGENSQYRLNVDGQAGKSFRDIPLLSGDSLYIFIETTYDIAPTGQNEFLYIDHILFDQGVNEQRVPLVTLVRDAVFLFPSTLADGSKESLLLGLDEEGGELRISGFLLEDDELQFTNEKPYVIYGYAAVGDGKVLTVEAGARVYFHEDSGILVGTGGSIRINGMLSEVPELLENEVIFEGDRLEPEFEDVPGQWGALWLAPGSVDNQIFHLTLRNATVGVLVEGNADSPSPALALSGVQIYNSSVANLWGRNTSVAGENVVLGNAGVHSLLLDRGGSYRFLHTTIANHWSNGFRTGTALKISTYDVNDPVNGTGGDLLRADFINCITDGNGSRELSLEQRPGSTFSFFFSHMLLTFRDSSGEFEGNPLYDFSNTSLYTSIFLNSNPDFTAPFRNDFTLGPESQAAGVGDPDAALSVPLDLLGRDRTQSPALGAYQQ